MMGQKIKKRKKGFTVGELLIVVGIISVLVSVAIPVLNKHLERAREAYDIYTMRQAASAAIELYYSGVHDPASAEAAKLSWSNGGNTEAANNAYGAYNPATGTFCKTRWDLPPKMRTYGKGTTRDGGTKYVLGNETGAYSAKDDYTQACVMVSIYPKASPKYAVIYWKRNTNPSSGPYIGGKEVENVPKYSIKILLD